MNRKQIGTPNMLALIPDSVMSVVKFKKHRASLISGQRVNDPKPLPLFKKVHPKTVDADYQPPTIDNVPDHWFDVYTRPSSSDRKSKITHKKGTSEFKVNVNK